MTRLDCSVKNCKYNEDNCCCKGNIEVDGSSATHSNETCCGSFVERGADSMRNAVAEPKKASEVSCKAEQCIHNDNCVCHASGINIAGDHACCCSETECETFTVR